MLEYLGCRDGVLPLVEFTYNNSFHVSIGMMFLRLCLEGVGRCHDSTSKVRI